MQSPLDGIFDQAENCYLKPDELQQVGQYVASIADRMSAYRALRDRELDLMQRAVDDLLLERPSLEPERIERTVKNGMLALRHGAMAMLLNDPSYLEHRLLSWLKTSVELQRSQGTDAAFFRLLKQQLCLTLSVQQMALFEPFFCLVDPVISTQEEEEMLTIAGIF